MTSETMELFEEAKLILLELDRKMKSKGLLNNESRLERTVIDLTLDSDEESVEEKRKSSHTVKESVPFKSFKYTGHKTPDYVEFIEDYQKFLKKKARKQAPISLQLAENNVPAVSTLAEVFQQLKIIENDTKIAQSMKCVLLFAEYLIVLGLITAVKDSAVGEGDDIYGENAVLLGRGSIQKVYEKLTALCKSRYDSERGKKKTIVTYFETRVLNLGNLVQKIGLDIFLNGHVKISMFRISINGCKTLLQQSKFIGNAECLKIAEKMFSKDSFLYRLMKCEKVGDIVALLPSES